MRTAFHRRRRAGSRIRAAPSRSSRACPGIMPADRPDQIPEPAGSEKDNAGGAEEQSAQGEDGEEGIGGGDPRKDSTSRSRYRQLPFQPH